MSQDTYDLLVKGIKEFQEIAKDQAPALGAVLEKQVVKLQEDILNSQYGKKLEKSLKILKLEEAIREFIRQYRPQLINMAAQYNPYLDRGALAQFVSRPLFFKILKEERDLFFDFETAFNKSLDRYKDLAKPYEHQVTLTPEAAVSLSKRHYHRYRGVPTGGPRPKRLIPISKMFQTHIGENYYRYNGQPHAHIKLAPYGLVGVFNLATSALYLHVDQTGRMSPKWETYTYPKKNSWGIHEQVVDEALKRAMRNNLLTPLPPKDVEEESKTKPKSKPPQKRTTAVEAIRMKVVTPVRASYYDPRTHRVDVMVPVTERGGYCNLDSEHAKRLLFYEITSNADVTHASVSRQLFRDVLPYALVVNPGEAFPLRDFLKFVPDKDTIRWVSEHIRPVIST